MRRVFLNSGVPRATALIAMVLATATSLTSCKRETRRFRESPPSATPGGAVRVSALQPGVLQDTTHVRNVYEGNAYAVSEGQRLFGWYNCSGATRTAAAAWARR
jgi:cytochrome c oxidase cbb3-type subunit 3